MQFELKRLPDYTDETLIDEMRRVAALVNHPTISRTEFQKHSRVHTSTLEKRFGCWENAMNAAGLSDRFDSSNKAVSKENIITELQTVSSKLVPKPSVESSSTLMHLLKTLLFGGFLGLGVKQW